MSPCRTLQTAALAVACAVVPASRANAQLTLGVGGGPSFPVGSLNNSNVTGYNVLAQLGIGLPSWPVGARLDGMFNQMNHKAGVPVGNLQVWTVNANLVWNVAPLSVGSAGIVPYLMGGAGYYNDSYHVSLGGGGGVSAGGNTHANNFGLNGGGGVRAGLASLSVFAEARYHYVFLGGGNHLQFVPITVGVVF